MAFPEPEEFPLEDAALWLSEKLGRKISTDYLIALYRDGQVELSTRLVPGLDTLYSIGLTQSERYSRAS